MKHVQISGSSGSGKSTLAKRLARKYNLEFIEIDGVFWKENWGTPTDAEFMADINSLLDTHDSRGWVIDGTYGSKLGDTITSRVDTIVFLDAKPWVTIPRVLRRSTGRMLRRELLWGKCRETPWGMLKLCHWIATTQKRRTANAKELIKNRGAEIDVHYFTSNREANTWFESL